MARFNYTKAQQTVIRLFDKFGGGRPIPMELHTLPLGRPGYNPGPADRSIYNVVAVVLPASKGPLSAFDNQLEEGTLVSENFRYVLISPEMTKVSGNGEESPNPQSLDELRFDGDRWSVLGCATLQPNGVKLLHQVGVKRI